MPKFTDSESYQVIWLTRRLFRALAQKSNENIVDLGITSADRAVIEFLYPDKKFSVPAIAEKFKVSRQHIQVTVNSLLENGLLVTKDNPRHKRSPHISLNAKGREIFSVVLEKDEEAVKSLFSHLSKKDIQITRQSLQSLLNKLT
ncbi:MAG: winged helix-turn-helix transcriptional regulator [Gammaproteobacteria bacterium]|jgi:DNA-binding MarR family transcriptional regulator|nr:winged helix-turn-helix transcriptional regulator [Gammaproteobacteria bacterium]